MSVDERAHLLKVLFGFVEGLFEHAGLLELVGAPVALVGEHEDAEGFGQACCYGGEEGADGLDFSGGGGGVVALAGGRGGVLVVLGAVDVDTAGAAAHAALPAGAAGAAAHASFPLFPLRLSFSAYPGLWLVGVWCWAEWRGRVSSSLSLLVKLGSFAQSQSKEPRRLGLLCSWTFGGVPVAKQHWFMQGRCSHAQRLPLSIQSTQRAVCLVSIAATDFGPLNR